VHDDTPRRHLQQVAQDERRDDVRDVLDRQRHVRHAQLQHVLENHSGAMLSSTPIPQTAKNSCCKASNIGAEANNLTVAKIARAIVGGAGLQVCGDR
jgi:hypothetical protein